MARHNWFGSIWITRQDCIGDDPIYVVRYPNRGYRAFRTLEGAQRFATQLCKAAQRDSAA